MTIRNLEHAVHPKSVAVIGASAREGSVGQVVMNNIIAAGFEGEVWPVNPKYREVAGRRCYRNASDLPGVPDLGVIVTPPRGGPRRHRRTQREGHACRRRHHRRADA